MYLDERQLVRSRCVEYFGTFNPDLIPRRNCPLQYLDIHGNGTNSHQKNIMGQLNSNTLEKLYKICSSLTRLSLSREMCTIIKNIWQHIIPDSNNEAINWINHKVNINDFLTNFKIEFQGLFYDNNYSPYRQFRNAKNCNQFVEFINSELSE